MDRDGEALAVILSARITPSCLSAAGAYHDRANLTTASTHDRRHEATQHVAEHATQSLRRLMCRWKAIFGAVLAPKFRFPSTVTQIFTFGRLSSNESEHIVLARPLGRHVGKPRYANAAGQPALDRGLDELGGEEGERDRHVDISLVAAVIAEAIEADAVVEMAEQDDVVLEPNVGSAASAAIAATATAHATGVGPADAIAASAAAVATCCAATASRAAACARAATNASAAASASAAATSDATITNPAAGASAASSSAATSDAAAGAYAATITSPAAGAASPSTPTSDAAIDGAHAAAITDSATVAGAAAVPSATITASATTIAAAPAPDSNADVGQSRKQVTKLDWMGDDRAVVDCGT
jgi:hypothetical protein